MEQGYRTSLLDFIQPMLQPVLPMMIKLTQWPKSYFGLIQRVDEKYNLSIGHI